ncbi:MAG: hypothetical protein P8Y02_13115 [Deinococcales bacterium]
MAAASAPFELAPGIAFAWTDPATDGLLAFGLRRGPTPRAPVTGVAVAARHLAVSGYRFGPEGERLTLRVRADSAGAVEVPALLVRTRYAPEQRLRTGAAEVLALPRAGGPLQLSAAAGDDALGLYAAFALVNDGAHTLTVRSVRYAPEPLGRGLVLVAAGPPGGFGAWKDAVLDQMTPAFAAFLERHGRSAGVAPRPVRPTALAFPLRGTLAASAWRAPDALQVRLQPGAALYLAITPAAFQTYVHDLTIVSYPVVGFQAAGASDCCELQGVPVAIVHPGRRAPRGQAP